MTFTFSLRPKKPDLAGDAVHTLSRRRFLAGLGLVAGAALAAPLLSIADSHAAMPLQSFPEDAEPAGNGILDDLESDREDFGAAPQTVQNYRWRRRQLLRRCRRDRRFRRENRRLCRRAEGSIGRPGRCVQIGPVTICE